MHRINGYRSQLFLRWSHYGTAIFAAAALAGCSISIDTTARDAEAVIEADFEGDCQGQGVEETDFGTVNYTKDDSSGSCVITLDWAGTLVDMGPIKEDIDEDADGADVTLEEIEIFLKLVSLTNAAGESVQVPTLTSVSGSVSIDGTPLYSVDGSSIDALVSPEGIRVKFSGENDPVVRAIDNALDAGGPLPATAQVSLTTTSTLPLQTGNPHRMTFRHDIKITASASASIF